MDLFSKTDMVMNILCLIGICSLTIIAVSILDTHRFVVKKYSVSSKQLSVESKFIFLSDLHNQKFGKNNEKLIRAIDEINPDYILVGGDLITYKSKSKTENAIKLVEKLSERYAIYYADGNHEQRFRDKCIDKSKEFEKNLTELSVEMMHNRVLFIKDQCISIAGLSLPMEYYRNRRRPQIKDAKIENWLRFEPESKFQILLAHHPEYFDAYCNLGVDLILSGHNHGGIARIPFGKGIISPAIYFFPKYDGGLFEKEDVKMIISRGMGTHTIPFRLFNPGELVVITLVPEK